MARGAATQLVLVAMVAAMLLVACDAAISCGQVTSALSPCISYARGNGANPPAACCSGVRRVWPAQPGAPLTSKRRASASRALPVGSTLARPPASPPSAASASPMPSAPPSTALRFADQPLSTAHHGCRL
ncbi:hypothetical protein VPH35_049474 [Triticum aestivum]